MSEITYLANPDERFRQSIAKLWFDWYMEEEGFDMDHALTVVDGALRMARDNWLPQMYIAADGDTAVGAVMAISIDNPAVASRPLYPVVSSLYVDPAYRNRGIAGGLIDCVGNFIFHESARRKIGHIYLCTSLDGFYEKLGFKPLRNGFGYWVLHENHPDEKYVYHMTRSDFERRKHHGSFDAVS